MSPEPSQRLRMFAGPNGSGKTSLARKLAREFSPDGFFQLHRFINADDILRDLQDGRTIALDSSGRTVTAERLCLAMVAGGRVGPNHPFLHEAKVVDSQLRAEAAACDSYVAAAVADFLREELLAAGESFSFETVMSHRNKVEFLARAKTAGYRTYVYFVATETSDLNILRVKTRTALGGHDVPADRIARRYTRCLELVGDALKHAHRAFLFDNSGIEPIWIAELTPNGELDVKVARTALPRWFERSVMPHFPS